MNFLKKIILTIATLSIVTSLLLTLTGCPPAPPAEEVIEETTPTPEEETTPEEKPIAKLSIWVDSLFAPPIEEISKPFTEQYEVEVTVQPMGMSDVHDQTLTASPVGEGPDILEGPHDWIGEFVEAGVITPIDLGDKVDLFLPASIQAFTYDGKIYGLPMITENLALFRNTDLVPEAPKTWDEFVEIAEELEAEGIEYRLLLQQGDAYHFFPIQTSFGGYVFGQKPDGTYDPSDIGIDSPGSLASAQWLDMMVKEGHIKAEVDFDTARSLFVEGKAAMYITGPWNISFFQESGMPYAISAIPAGTEEAKPFLGVRGLMVNSFSKELILSKTYLTEWWTTEESMQKYYDGVKKPCAFLPVQEKIVDPDIAALGEAGMYAMPMPAIPEMSAFWTTMGDAITLVLQQQKDPVEAFKTAAEQVRTAIEE